jgi:peptidoglycan/LPS O-acetylase OafA/YrhL
VNGARLSYQPHIDGLRGIAVVSVVGFHLFPAAIPGGFLGVDVFFVISGFLISTILYADFSRPNASGAKVIGNFYSRRVKRIFPSLVVVLAAVLIAGYVLLLPSELVQLSKSLILSGCFGLNIFLAGATDYFGADSQSNPLLNLWSLGVEEQFYLVWPLVIWLMLRFRAGLLPITVFLGACSFFLNVHKFESELVRAFYLPQTRLWELLVGAAAAALMNGASENGSGGKRAAIHSASGFGWRGASGRPWVSSLLTVVGCALIGVSIRVARDNMGLPNGWSLLPTLGAALVVCSGGMGWVNRSLLSNRILVWVGLISYPLYLWHWPLLSYSRMLAERPDTLAAKMAVIFLSFILAWLTYVLVEVPIRGATLRSTTPKLLGAMVLTVCVAAFVGYEGGFPERFPPLMKQISDWHYDPSGPYRQGTYFLAEGQDERDFKVDPYEVAAGKPSIVLWGDSHAAALYAGLNKVFGRQFNIVQRTSAKTPPFLGRYLVSDGGRRISGNVIDIVQRIHPQLVILEAAWERYEWRNVEATIGELKNLGVPHIVLVGPVPLWNESLPHLVFEYIRWHRNKVVPLRIQGRINQDPLRIDKAMEAMSRRLGIDYVSPCAILGNADGFLVRAGDGVDDLMDYDSSHLTANGSIYLVSRFPSF